MLRVVMQIVMGRFVISGSFRMATVMDMHMHMSAGNHQQRAIDTQQKPGNPLCGSVPNHFHCSPIDTASMQRYA
jgi:hypothetical protein